MSLGSLIVQRGIASIREIEEALARQVLYGGDFVTNLLEVSRIEEAALLPIVAEFHGLKPGPVGELPKAGKEALRLVAAEVVSERGFAPLEVGASLVVAVAEPLSADVEQELGFALALPIEQVLAPRFRIRQALARDYGLPIDKRTTRLIAKVVQKGPRMASTYPPPRESNPNLRSPPRPPSKMPPPAPLPVQDRPTALPKNTFVRESEGAPLRPVRRRRGPLTGDVARTELEASAERDVIFDLLFEFARQFFDYTALFIVHGDIAEGRDAFGDGASREKVARVGVPLDMDNLLATARRSKKTHRALPQKDGLDTVLMSDLGREGTTECIVFPVIVRSRVVAIVFGDGGPSGIDDEGVRQVAELVDLSQGAFERVIVRRKLKKDEPTSESKIAARIGAAESVPAITQPSASPHDVPDSRGQRPAIEELAPPIQELLLEPMSKETPTERDLPPLEVVSPSKILEPFPRAPSDQPPPVELLQVKRPSGRPIPREEPRSEATLVVSDPAGSGIVSASPVIAAVPAPTAGTAAAALAGASTPPIASGEAEGPKRTKSQQLRRAQAPDIQFGTPKAPSISSLVPSEAPRTTVDAEPWAPAPSGIQRNAEAPSGIEPRGRGASVSVPPRPTPPPLPPEAFKPSTPPRRPTPPPLPPEAFTPSVPPRRPTPPPLPPEATAAISPRPPEPAAASPRPPSKTLQSGLPMFPAVPPDAPTDAPARVVPTVVEVIGSAPVDPDATPIAPHVVDPEFELTPVQPFDLVSPASGEPVLPLSQRKVSAAPPMPAPVAAPAPAASMAPATPSPLVPATPPSRVPPSRMKKPMPASESQVSVAPHKPPSSRNIMTSSLPSIIVDVGDDYEPLVARVLKGGDEDAEAELLRAGAHALPVIMAKFPGPITIDRERLEGSSLPRVAECGPVIRMVASQRRTALSEVLMRVESTDAETRFWATYLLTELVYADSVAPAVVRAFDSDLRVRRAARAAIRVLAETHGQLVVERLAENLRNVGDPRRLLAIDALGDSREPLAVPVLVPILEEAGDAAESALSALVLITQHDFGTNGAQWARWWDENKNRHRIEWLIDSLTSDQRALRTSASEELKTITKEQFGYYDNLPKRERVTAQARFREWWETVGRIRFSKAASTR